MLSICNLSSFKLFLLFPHDTLAKEPWRAALVASVGPLPVALWNRLSSVLDISKACLASFSAQRVLSIFLGECHLYYFVNTIYVVTLSLTSDLVLAII